MAHYAKQYNIVMELYTHWAAFMVTHSHTNSCITFFSFWHLGLLRVPGYPSGTRVINYPGNFLLPDGYAGSEYLIFRIYLIGFSSIIVFV